MSLDAQSQAEFVEREHLSVSVLEATGMKLLSKIWVTN